MVLWYTMVGMAQSFLSPHPSHPCPCSRFPEKRIIHLGDYGDDTMDSTYR